MQESRFKDQEDQCAGCHSELAVADGIVEERCGGKPLYRAKMLIMRIGLYPAILRVPQDDTLHTY